MCQRLSAPNAAKLISEWTENDDRNDENVEFHDNSDVSQADAVGIYDCEHIGILAHIEGKEVKQFCV